MQLTSREIGGDIAFLFSFLIFHANNLITSIDKIMVPSKIKVEFKVKKIFCHCFLYSGYGYLTFSDKCNMSVHDPVEHVLYLEDGCHIDFRV